MSHSTMLAGTAQITVIIHFKHQNDNCGVDGRVCRSQCLKVFCDFLSLPLMWINDASKHEYSSERPDDALRRRSAVLDVA